MFNDRITIQQRAVGADTIGQPISEWIDLGVFWADVRHLRGLETLRAGADVSVLRASVRMWYRSEVDAAMRLVHGETTYEIKSPPLRNADRRFMDLVCEAAK